MADYVLLSGGEERERAEQNHGDQQVGEPKIAKTTTVRLASLDVFRGLCIVVMIFVDYAGSVFPSIAHSPWNGIRLADFVTPFFLFIAGISLSLVYKRTFNRCQQTQKAVLRALKLVLLGILLQGGYFHGANSLTFGVDIENIRWFGILQRIAIGYIIAALCEIWCSKKSATDAGDRIFKNYYLHWILMFLLSGIYLGLLYGLYVPDWQFNAQQSTSSTSFQNGYVHRTVKCNVRGDLGPACNSAGMIDRYVLGINHLYRKPAYRNLKECRTSMDRQVSEDSPSWCQAPFDPEGLLGSLMAAVTCIFGLQFGHVLVSWEGHKDRLVNWLLLSVSIFLFGLFLTFTGIPINKQLYSITYMLLTTASAGFTFCFFYILVDVYGFKCLTFVLEWTGRHSLSIFVLIASNVAVIFIQGFYWKDTNNNIVHWVISLFVHKSA